MYVRMYACSCAHTKYICTYIPSFTKPVSHYSNNTRPSSRLKVQGITQLTTPYLTDLHNASKYLSVCMQTENTHNVSTTDRYVHNYVCNYIYVNVIPHEIQVL